jgi:hypothetical protein
MAKVSKTLDMMLGNHLDQMRFILGGYEFLMQKKIVGPSFFPHFYEVLILLMLSQKCK